MRNKGDLNKTTRAGLYDLDLKAESKKNIAFLKRVRDNRRQPMMLRTRAAEALQPFFAPKLSTVDINQIPGMNEHEEKSEEQMVVELADLFTKNPEWVPKIIGPAIAANASILTGLMAAFPAIVAAYQEKVISLPRAQAN